MEFDILKAQYDNNSYFGVMKTIFTPKHVQKDQSTKIV